MEHKKGFSDTLVQTTHLLKKCVLATDKEISNHLEYGNGKIMMKMNSLTDKAIIEKLFEASQAGVKIQLIIRGICCLKPGVPGISENIIYCMRTERAVLRTNA